MVKYSFNPIPNRTCKLFTLSAKIWATNVKKKKMQTFVNKNKHLFEWHTRTPVYFYLNWTHVSYIMLVLNWLGCTGLLSLLFVLLLLLLNIFSNIQSGMLRCKQKNSNTNKCHFSVWIERNRGCSCNRIKFASHH